MGRIRELLHALRQFVEPLCELLLLGAPFRGIGLAGEFLELVAEVLELLFQRGHIALLQFFAPLLELFRIGLAKTLRRLVEGVAECVLVYLFPQFTQFLLLFAELLEVRFAVQRFCFLEDLFELRERLFHLLGLFAVLPGNLFASNFGGLLRLGQPLLLLREPLPRDLFFKGIELGEKPHCRRDNAQRQEAVSCALPPTKRNDLRRLDLPGPLLRLLDDDGLKLAGRSPNERGGEKEFLASAAFVNEPCDLPCVGPSCCREGGDDRQHRKSPEGRGHCLCRNEREQARGADDGQRKCRCTQPSPAKVCPQRSNEVAPSDAIKQPLELGRKHGSWFRTPVAPRRQIV